MPGKTRNSSYSVVGSRRPLGSELLPAETQSRIAAAERSNISRQQALAWARSLGDGLGRGLDREMILPMAALYYIGVPTTASCQGHGPRERPGAHSFPWIDFPAPIENGQFLLSALPGWTIVQRGQGAARSYRLNPSEITAIDDRRHDRQGYSFWEPARQQLQQLATNIFSR